MSFFPRNEASDTGRPSIAEGSETAGNGSPGLNPLGSGENRAHTGFDPGFDCPAANGAPPTANSNASIAERICADDMRGLARPSTAANVAAERMNSAYSTKQVERRTLIASDLSL
jgi:hypothetical protein